MKTYQLPSVLTIDYSKWRCGFNGKNQVGKGDTKLHNDEGYECCLGQWANQAGVQTGDLDLHYPSALPHHGICVLGLTNNKTQTALAKRCADINDNRVITTAKRVKRLKAVLGKSHYKLKLKNFPPSVISQLKKLGVKCDIQQADEEDIQDMR